MGIEYDSKRILAGGRLDPMSLQSGDSKNLIHLVLCALHLT